MRKYEPAIVAEAEVAMEERSTGRGYATKTSSQSSRPYG